MSKYSEIIEMEVLNGIDRAMHVLLVEYNESRSNGLDVFCMRDIEELKHRIPKYIDKQFKTIISENLSDSVRMFPPVSE
ncbi:MAG: hypothetical protein K2I82_07040 [Ruminococcus sp.]|nr:hypothetical protein [Ruminococcus sp.]